MAGDAFKNIEMVCQENGFALESYTLVTPDDYVLSLYRIPGTFADLKTASNSKQKNDQPKPAVLMQHCQDCDMMEWIWNDAERANAFILARNGYDVWMGNNRGSKYSRAHLTLNPDEKAYWDFYQEDMGRKDVPTFVDFILEKTSLETISYVGHSEGTTQFILGASLMPEYYTSKINLSILLAPVGNTANIPIPYLREAAKYIREVQFALVHELNYANWFAPMPKGEEALAAFCGILPSICKNAASLMHHDGVDNGERFATFISNEPSGASYRTFVYYAQMINSGKATLYDYGPLDNHKIYGQKEAPLIPIENYKVPTVLMSGSLDKLADPADVKWLSDALGDNVVFEKEYLNDHFTFAIGKDMSFFSVDAVE